MGKAEVQMEIFMKTLLAPPFAASSDDGGQRTESRESGLCFLSVVKFPGDKSMTSLAQEIIRPLNWLAAPPANALLTLFAVGNSVDLAVSCGFGDGR